MVESLSILLVLVMSVSTLKMMNEMADKKIRNETIIRATGNSDLWASDEGFLVFLGVAIRNKSSV